MVLVGGVNGLGNVGCLGAINICERRRERVSICLVFYYICGYFSVIVDNRTLHKKKNPQTQKKEKPRDPEEEEEEEAMCCSCGEDCECRPLGFLVGLPFAFLSLLLSLIGVIIWIVGLLLSCICPCCLCVTVIVELALGLIKAPIHVMKWFTEQIPC